MPALHHDSLRLHFDVHGGGEWPARGEALRSVPPVVLLHGGVSSFEHNFGQFGWVEALAGAGRQVVGLDLRGHGCSDRPHDAARYGTSRLAGDVLALLEHLQLPRVALVGYSIGAAIVLELMRRAPVRVERAVLVAAGDGLIGYPPHSFPEVLPGLVQAFERESYPADLPKSQSAYWKILESVGGDRRADAGDQRRAGPGARARPAAGRGAGPGRVSRDRRRQPFCAGDGAGGAWGRGAIPRRRIAGSMTPRIAEPSLVTTRPRAEVA